MSCSKHGPLLFPDGLNGETICTTCGEVVSQSQACQDYTNFTPKWTSNWNEDDSDTLRKWLTILRTVSCQLNLPSFPYREEAARIVKQKRNMLFRSQRFGKNKREAVTALIHIVLRKYNKIRSLKEICESLSLSYRLVSRYAWGMQEMLNVHNKFSAKDYLRSYGWKLTQDTRMIESAEKLLTTIQRKIGGNPTSLAAAALYFVCKGNNVPLSKEKVGEVFHISSRTVYSNERRISKLLSTTKYV